MTTGIPSRGGRKARLSRRSLLGVAVVIVLGALLWLATGRDLALFRSEITRPGAGAPGPERGQAPRGAFDGKVVAVIDGDTIDVLYEGQAVRVRLAEIDCPEKKQAFGKKAKERTSELVFGKRVHVEPSTIDRYGRAVAKVLLPDGSSLNEALLRDGFAWWYRRYSKDPRLGEIEDEARGARRGLWADPSPTPPWKFRKRHRKRRAGESVEGESSPASGT